MTALMVLLRALSQAGQIGEGASGNEGVVFEVLKLIITRDFKERECLFVGEEEGQRGGSLGGAEIGWSFLVEGVREGTQKEGSLGSAACGFR